MDVGSAALESNRRFKLELPKMPMSSRKILQNLANLPKNHPKQSKTSQIFQIFQNLRQMQLPCVDWAAFKGAGDSPPQAAHSRGGPVSRLHIGSLAPRSDSVLVALG